MLFRVQPSCRTVSVAIGGGALLPLEAFCSRCSCSRKALAQMQVISDLAPHRICFMHDIEKRRVVYNVQFQDQPRGSRPPLTPTERTSGQTQSPGALSLASSTRSPGPFTSVQLRQHEIRNMREGFKRI